MTQLEINKSYGFDKPRIKIYPISFRLDDKRHHLLNTYFETLQIKPKKDTITNRMLELIDNVDVLINTNREQTKTISELNSKIKGLEKKEKERVAEIDELKKGKPIREGIPGEIVKDYDTLVNETGRIVKENDETYGKATCDTKVHRDKDEANRNIIVHSEPQKELFPRPKCLRSLQSNSQEQWLVACEVCRGQAPQIFDKCATTMRQTFINSNP